MIKRLGLFRRDAGATALIEFAIVAPLLLILCLGGVEGALLVLADMRLTNAAADVADLVAEQTSVDDSSIANFCTAAQLDMTPLSATPLQIAIASVTNSGSSATIVWQDSCNGAPSVTDAMTLASGLVPVSGDSVIIVEASYQYKLPIGYLLPSSIKLTQTALYRPRDSANVTFN
jgi:Flp pilus assembly protein TadG